MKIKCPFCERIEEYNSYERLGNHLQSHKERSVYPFVISFCLAELLFKIHETKEYFEESGYSHETRILKSLLEDER